MKRRGEEEEKKHTHTLYLEPECVLQHTLMKRIQVTNQKPERGFESSDSSVTVVLSNNGATLYQKRSILKWE